MKILIWASIVLFLLGFFIPSQYAESVLENDNYTLEGWGFSVSEKSVEVSSLSINFEIKDSVSGKILEFEKGSIVISGNEFNILDNINARLLRDGNLFRLSGAIENGDRLSVFGKIIEESKDGAVYSVRGVLVSDSTEKKRVVYSVKITNIPKFEETAIIDESELIDRKEITMITSHTGFRELKQTFNFQVRVYDSEANPPPDFTLNQDVIDSVNVTVTIQDSNGIVVKSFEGLTNKQGYFIDGYRLPETLKTGKYLVEITAQLGESKISKQLDLFVSERTN